MPRKGRKSLYVRRFPSDLLGRVNGIAEFIGMERDEFVTELLRQEMKRFEEGQKNAVEWWKDRSVLDSKK
jgi:hypothetical protein